MLAGDDASIPELMINFIALIRKYQKKIISISWFETIIRTFI